MENLKSQEKGINVEEAKMASVQEKWVVEELTREKVANIEKMKIAKYPGTSEISSKFIK